MPERRISTKKVRDLLDQRIKVCSEASERHRKAGEDLAAATERCAMLELQFVRTKLFPMGASDDR